jgi:uncharacterized protein (DUF924 family)
MPVLACSVHRADEVIQFWFEELTQKDWWGSSPELDARIAQRFSTIHAAVAAGETFRWRLTAEGRLAEVIVLDQFSRQMFRGTGRAFAYDGIALVLAQEAVAQRADEQLTSEQRTFLYMPYMHSESLIVHDEALRLFESLGNDWVAGFERRHRDVIVRFGRYPKRNAALGRTSTPEELAYIREGSDPF